MVSSETNLSQSAIALVGPTTMFPPFSVLICHNLSIASSPPTFHRLTSFIHTVLRLRGKHFPSISPSITAITSHSLLLFKCP